MRPMQYGRAGAERQAFWTLLIAGAWLFVPLSAGQPPLDRLGAADAELTRRFTPMRVAAGVYTAHAVDEPIDALARALAPGGPADPDGAWQVQRLDPGDAFGSEPPYDRARLARLYDGERPRVVRGPLLVAGERVSLTLVSPYPDARLAVLQPGTLVIVHRFERPHAP